MVRYRSILKLSGAAAWKLLSEPNDMKVHLETDAVRRELDDFREWDAEFQGSWFTAVIDRTLDMADKVRNDLRAGARYTRRWPADREGSVSSASDSPDYEN